MTDLGYGIQDVRYGPKGECEEPDVRGLKPESGSAIGGEQQFASLENAKPLSCASDDERLVSGEFRMTYGVMT